MRRILLFFGLILGGALLFSFVVSTVQAACSGSTTTCCNETMEKQCTETGDLCDDDLDCPGFGNKCKSQVVGENCYERDFCGERTDQSSCDSGQNDTCRGPGGETAYGGFCTWDDSPADTTCPTGFIWCEGCNACMENTQTCTEWEAGGCAGGGDGSGGDGGGAGSCSDWCTSPAECGENGGTIVSQPCTWDSCSSGEPCYVPPNPPQEPGQVDCSVGTKTITMQVGETRVINPRYGLNQPYEWNWVERRGQNVTKVGGSSVNIDSVNTALPETSGIYSDGEAQITATSPGYTVLQVRGTGGNEIDGVCTCSNVCCGDEIDYTFECTSQWTVIVEQPEADPWMQISNGNLFSAADTGDSINAPIPLACDGNALCTAALLTENAVNTANSDGFAITGGGSVSTNGFYNERTPDPTAIGSALSRIEPNYQYFYRLLELPETPADDFAGSHSDARRPNPFGTTIDDQVFFSDGDLTIQERWWVPDGGTVIVVVDGDLTFENPSNYGYLSEVVPGGFLMFVVSGDIIVDETVGHTNNSTARSLAGFFVTNGQVDIQSTGNVATERTLVFEGSVVAWNGFSFSRDLGDAAHAQRPAELFRYRPDLLLNTPEYLKEPQQTWQEVN